MEKISVGDKVIVDGKETEITATAFDEEGIKVYMVKGSMKDYYEEELKLIQMEEDIFIIESFLKDKEMLLKHPCWISKKTVQAIENLTNKNKEQEKMIELMAKGLFDYANLGVLIDCPAEYDGIRDLRSCPKDKKCLKCIIEYFEKKSRNWGIYK